jgi:uncharacterized membrane protein
MSVQYPFVSRLNVGEDRTVSLSLTPTGTVVLLLGVQLALLAFVLFARLGYQFSLLRATVAVLYLTIVPGFLVLEVIGIDPEERTDYLLYAVGLSVVSFMFIGVVANFVLRALGVANPISELPVVFTTLTVTLALTGLYYRRDTGDGVSVSFDLDRLLSPPLLFVLLLPFLGIYGAYALQVYDTNVLLLILYAGIGLVLLLAVYRYLPPRYYPLAIWMISISLLLQNTLVGNYLAWGDQPKEASLALFVLNNGYWDPGVSVGFAGKYTMLRIVILHPVHALLTDLEMVWVFKLIHPILFSVTPVALYQAYKRYTDKRAAFISSFLYISLFSFFIVLSRNTRTATAILFLSLLLLLIADDDLDPVYAQLLAILFASAVVVSHYGVSYILLFALVLIIPLVKIMDVTLGRDSNGLTSGPFALLYIAVTFSWYLYASPESKAFNILIGFYEQFTTALSEEFFSASTSASTRIIANDWNSTTLEMLKYFNVLVGALIGIGLLSVFVRLYAARYRGTSPDPSLSRFDSEFLAYALVFLGIFGITFLPVERFNTARTYPTSLVFFAPFFIVGIRELARLLKQAPISQVHMSDVRPLAAGLVLVFFLLNVGFISATITHEYSTNALVEKERITDEGHPREKEYFYKQYPTAYDAASSAWLLTHAYPNATVYASRWPGGVNVPIGYAQSEAVQKRANPIETKLFSRTEPLGEGYVYLRPYSYIGRGVISLPAGHFEFDWVYTDQIDNKWNNKNRIYANGGSVIYY